MPDWNELTGRMHQLQLRSRALKEWARELHYRARLAVMESKEAGKRTAALRYRHRFYQRVREANRLAVHPRG